MNDDTQDTKELAIIAFLYLFLGISGVSCKPVPAVEVVLCSRLPAGAGLGSSAAFSTCLSAALLLYMDQVENTAGSWSDLDLVNKWSFQCEKIIHGKPSGIDNSVSTYGGAVILQAGKLSFLENIPELRILLINTKVPRSTKVLVAGVREKYNKHTSVMTPILDAIEAISEKSINVYGTITPENREQSYDVIKDMVEMNQQLLNFIGVGHPAIDNVVMMAKQYGLFSKLTGAGGGGCVFAIVPPDVDEKNVEELKVKLSECGYESWETSIGANGVSRHPTPEMTFEPIEHFLK